ncbi:hypothetical protein ES705_34132 [subsurface metagenome]
MTTSKGKSGFDIRHYVQSVLPSQYERAEPQIASFMELIANALDASRIDLYPSLRDAGASRIEINIDGGKGILEVIDYGIGMDKQQLVKYHDFIASTKKTGKEIGFAGQGAKLALNFCSTIVTETWSKSYRGYSEWQLKGDEAPWEIIDDRVLQLDHRGTKVTLYLDSESKTFYTEELIKEILTEHYLPLLDPRLLKVYTGEVPVLEDRGSTLRVYKPIYDKGLKFILNGEVVAKEPIQNMLTRQDEVSVSVYRSPKARGFFGLAKDSAPEVLQGIAISTYGKIIERTLFKKEPREKQRIVGWIEAPYLIESVTTSKCRFQRGTKIVEGFFRKGQSEFSKWLEEIGLSEKPVERKPDFSNLEREINSILRNFPELTFFGLRTQRDVAIPDEAGEQRELGEGTQKVPGTKGGKTSGEGISVYPGQEPGKAPTLELGPDVSATPHQRIIRGGVGFAYEERPELAKEARFEGETVYINISHSAYERAEREKLLSYHIPKSVVLSLIEFKLENDPEPSYQKAFELSQRFFKLWGEQ